MTTPALAPLSQVIHQATPNVSDSLLHQYEQALVKSLLTSFGLDFLLANDRRGGHVDTLHTVRDSSVGYADANNEARFKARGEYDSAAYHSTDTYIQVGREYKAGKQAGTLQDAYTGQTFAANADVHRDHTISAKAIHDDPARVLAGRDGVKLANQRSNLNATAGSVNTSKKDKSAEQFINYLDQNEAQRKAEISLLQSKQGTVGLDDKERKRLNKLEKLDAVDQKKLREQDRIAREAYEKELASSYYTSSEFLAASASASLNQGLRMGARETLGMVMLEAWNAVRQELPHILQSLKGDFELGLFLQHLGNVCKGAFERVQAKRGELLKGFKDGMLAGVLSSVMTTLINIFFTTAKNVAKILRESWATIVESVKTLVFNPQRLPFGELLRAVSKIVATGVSVCTGALIQEAISKVPGLQVPILGDILSTFISALASGLLNISLLYFIDHSPLVSRIVSFANSLKSSLDYTLDYYKAVSQRLETYTAELAGIDFQQLQSDLNKLQQINASLVQATTNADLNDALFEAMKTCKIDMPYKDRQGLDDFMNDKDAVLVF